MGLDYGRALPLDTKALGDVWQVEGYISTLGNIDSGLDVIVPGAFDDALASGRRVKFLFAHNQEKVLGPPLDLRLDDVGLFATGRLSKTDLGAYVHTLLLDGGIDSWSIGYVATAFDYQETPQGLVRRIKNLELYEASLLPLPMNEAAVVTSVKAAPGTAIHAATCTPDACTCTPRVVPLAEAPLAGHGLPYAEHAARLAAGVTEFLTRTRQGAALREQEGRALSAARRDQMAQMSGSLRQAAGTLEALLAESAPAPAPPSEGFAPGLALALRKARLRHRGVPVEGALP